VTEQIQTPPAPEAGRAGGGNGDTLLEVTDLVRHFPVTRGVVFRRKVGAVQAISPTGEIVARDALVELGWSVLDAERALQDVDESLPIEEQVRLALRRAA